MFGDIVETRYLAEFSGRTLVPWNMYVSNICIYCSDRLKHIVCACPSVFSWWHTRGSASGEYQYWATGIGPQRLQVKQCSHGPTLAVPFGGGP